MDFGAVNGPRGTPVIQGIEQVSTRQLPDRQRLIFPFPLFNAIQSKCFKTVYNSNDNFVLSAPTGSGKTAVLELAICHLIARAKGEEFKVVYQAPTKSLCSERQRDWQAKFSHLGLECAELTGDTEHSQLREVQTADILITTPEKWDSMTRKWKDQKRLIELVKLFLIDEVHILKDDRGACLEAIVSRMKSVGSNIRFIALSATVPNSGDIATWLGLNSRVPGMPAVTEVFGEEFRPVRLSKHVHGVQASGVNDFAFDKICDKHLPDVVQKYSARKPIMIFCMTRKSCEATATLLATWWADSQPQDRFWKSPSRIKAVRSENLRECLSKGVAYHHAGVDQTDRAAIEEGYLSGEVSVICCTSTLAVGINLPCHFVIIKNTVVYYQSEGCKEYSDIEVMQMLGRAGRPQFDRSAVAVILTRSEKVDHYQRMVGGKEILESKLHLNLIEHLNAEIVLGTIHDQNTAKLWLKGTFLFVRFRKNPDHYQLSQGIPNANSESIADLICTDAVNQLRDFSLINGNSKIKCTEFGDAMARYYVQFETMKLFMGLQRKAKISEILSAIALASEFKSIRFRSNEKQMFKEINESPSIKFPIKVDIALGPHKVSLMIQATLGGLDMRKDERFSNHSQQFIMELSIVFQHVHRLIRCIIDCQIHLEDSVAVRNALELSRSLGARAWDHSPLQLQQIEKIGPVAVRKLVNAGIKTIEELEETESQRIDMILSRNPPFALNLLRDVKEFPKLRISLKMLGKPLKKSDDTNAHVRVEVEAEVGFLNECLPKSFRKRQVHVVLLAETSDGHLVHFCRISAQKIANGQSIRFSVDLVSSQQLINCYVSCDDIAGTQRYATLNPIIPASAFAMAIPSNGPRPIQPGLQPRRTLQSQNVLSRSDDFGLDDIDDCDLVAAGEAEFEDIDEIDSALHKSRQSHRNRSSVSGMQTNSDEKSLPIKLDNGNWACNHACKDKTKCKHLCCREGLEKPPKRPKGSTSKVPAHETTIASKRDNQLKDYFSTPTRDETDSESNRPKTQSNMSKRRISPQHDSGNETIDSDDPFEQWRATPQASNHSRLSVKPELNQNNHYRMVLTDTSSPEKAATHPVETLDLTGDISTSISNPEKDAAPIHLEGKDGPSHFHPSPRKKQRLEAYGNDISQSNLTAQGDKKRQFTMPKMSENGLENEKSEFLDSDINTTQFTNTIESSSMAIDRFGRQNVVNSPTCGNWQDTSVKTGMTTAPYGYGPVQGYFHAVDANTKDGTFESRESLDQSCRDAEAGRSMIADALNNRADRPTSESLQNTTKCEEGIDNWLMEQFGDVVEFV